MRADAITTFSISTCSTGNNADRRAAGRQGGGKVAARCRCRVRTPMPLRGACGTWHWRTLVGLQGHFRGAQQARSAPRTNVRELFCCRKITRNDSDKAERSERSPPLRSRARKRKCFATGPAPATGGESGGRARRPPEPSAGRRSGARYPPGSLPVLALKNCYPPGSSACSCGNAKPNIKLMRDLKAEMNLTPAEREQAIRRRTPKTLRVKGASPSLQNLHKKRKKL